MSIVPPPPSTRAIDLPLGTRLVAGIGEATVLADFDFETYSEAGYVWDESTQKWLAPFGLKDKGIGAVGLQVYAEHPTTEVICLSYNLKDGKGTRLWVQGMEPPHELFAYLAQGGLIEAWNAPFEERIWNEVCVKKYGWPALPLHQVRCAAAKSRASCYPNSLADAGKVIDTPEQKMELGSALIKRFSVPQNPTKKDPRKRISVFEDELGGEMFRYNMQDIVTEAELSSRIPDLNPFETQYWLMDLMCNKTGVAIDTEALAAAISFLDEAYKQSQERLTQLTHGYITSVSQNAKIVAFLQANGVETKSIDEEHLEKLLKRTDLHPVCREVLEIRNLLGSASVKKFYTMRAQLSQAGRVHDMFVAYGARTGRDAGRGVQPQNLPNSGPNVKKCGGCPSYFDPKKNHCPRCSCDAGLCATEEWSIDSMEFCIDMLKKGALQYYFSDMADILIGCIRGFFIADEGHDMICSDYSSIEAVVAACLTGCQWRIDTFARKECIYLASVSKITGTPVETYLAYKKQHGSHHPDRKMGKIAELASGYGGWLGSWVNFGADSFFKTEDEIKEKILAWRAASPEIVEAWGGQMRRNGAFSQNELFGLEGKFIEACYRPGRPAEWRCGVYYIKIGKTVYCVLPSGRSIAYHDVELRPSTRNPGQLTITYKTWNSNPLMGQIGWHRLDTYGGRLFENVVQAVAREIMAFAAVNLQAAGYSIRLRIHDELAAMVPEGWGSVEEFERIGGTLPAWAAGWPIRMAGGWRGKRYRK